MCSSELVFPVARWQAFLLSHIVDSRFTRLEDVDADVCKKVIQRLLPTPSLVLPSLLSMGELLPLLLITHSSLSQFYVILIENINKKIEIMKRKQILELKSITTEIKNSLAGLNEDSSRKKKESANLKRGQLNYQI